MPEGQQNADILQALAELREENREDFAALDKRMALLEDRSQRAGNEGWSRFWTAIAIQCSPVLIQFMGFVFLGFVWLMIQGGWKP